MQSKTCLAATSLLVVGVSLYSKRCEAGHPAPQLKTTIRSSQPAANAGFGQYVSGGNGAVFVGSPWSNEAYNIDLATGETLATLRSPDPAPTVISFGTTMMSWGDSITVTDPESDFGASRAGAVHVYNLDGSYTRTLRGPANSNPYAFGYRTQSVDQRLFVSASHSNSGYHTLYGYDPGSDEPAVTIEHPVQTSSGWFSVLATDGHALFASSQGVPSPSGTGNGAVYRFSAASGELEHTFQDPAPDALWAFGADVEATSFGLLVSSTSMHGPGKVYLLDPNDGSVLKTLAEPEAQSAPRPSAFFSSSIAVIDNYAFVSAPEQWVDGKWGAGAVFQFDLRTGNYVGKLVSPEPDVVQSFGGGAGLAVLGNHLLVGARGTDYAGMDHAGAVYVYSVPEPSTLLLVAIGCFGLPLIARKRRSSRD